jgi:hypothetical protein
LKKGLKEGEEEQKDVGTYWGDVKEKLLEFERSGTRSHCGKKWLWNGL